MDVNPTCKTITRVLQRSSTDMCSGITKIIDQSRQITCSCEVNPPISQQKNPECAEAGTLLSLHNATAQLEAKVAQDMPT